jgi:AmmeMemoRadiSam system protein B/AmmeMemoRadiSam system protein A
MELIMFERMVIIMLLTLLGFVSANSQNRAPAAAGTFYPADVRTLTAQIKQYLDAAGNKQLPSKPRILIAPHAGYVYSGPVAAYGYKELKDEHYEAIVIISPSHVEYFEFAAIYSGDTYETPLGKVSVAKDLARQLPTADGLVRIADNGHSTRRFERGEHALEVQLPFLQIVQPNTPIIPIIIGTLNWKVIETLGNQIGKLLSTHDILVVISSDLSHYHSYTECQKIDQRLVNALQKLDARLFYRGLTAEDYEACGGGPICVGLIAAKAIGANQISILRLANSGDSPYGDKSGVVGYLSAAIYQDKSSKNTPQVKQTTTTFDKGDLTREEQLFLLDLAELTVRAAVNKQALPKPQSIPPRLTEKRGAFVTLEKNHELRGCIGYILPIYPLYQTVIEVAQSAALRDPRFEPVSPRELKDITVEISVLTVPEKISYPEQIEVGKHGIIIKRGFNQGLLLPQVATDYGWDRETFLEHTCLKAGLPRDAWKDKTTEIQIFSAQVFSRETIK